MAARVVPVLGAIAFVAVAAVGCGDSETTSGTNDEEIKIAAHCESDFGAPLRAKVAKAHEALDRSPARYAAEVRAALDEKRVTVLPFCAMSEEHFEHFKEDADLAAFGKTPEEQFARLRAGETKGMRSIHAQLFGYMWEDKVYLASNMNESSTLETIAHETRHVLREAHLRNFHDQRVTCVEELEAARAEVLVHKDEITPEEDANLRARVLDLYELDKIKPGTCGFKER